MDFAFSFLLIYFYGVPSMCSFSHSFIILHQLGLEHLFCCFSKDLQWEQALMNSMLGDIQWSAKRMDHGSFSSTFLRIHCSLNIVVYSFMLCSCATLPLVWANLSESWGLEDVFVLVAIFSSWEKKYALAGKGAKRCFWLTWMSVSKINRKYWAVMSVESFENGLFCQKQAKNDKNS